MDNRALAGSMRSDSPTSWRPHHARAAPAGGSRASGVQPGAAGSNCSPRCDDGREGPALELSPFIVKLAGRCNLDCSYCYVYNRADGGWRTRPALMSDAVYDATLARIRRHCIASGQTKATIVFHGGEPTLVGARRFDALCAAARERLGELVDLELSLQTNATRLDGDWAQVLARHDVSVGVSLDGPPEVNDRARVDRRGRGTHAAVVRGIQRLREADVRFAILSVIALGADPLAVHDHFVALGASSISYLLPAHTHETIASVRARHGPTPCADFLIAIFDHWWERGAPEVWIREFWNIGRVILGGSSQLDAIGNPPIRFVTIETDGSIHGLDKLRACQDGLTATGLNVCREDFAAIERASPIHGQMMRGLPLPSACAPCPEATTCAGGYVAHRYSRARGLDNPSVWCADLLKLFAHVRARMGVSHAQTAIRRAQLIE
jgi:uncharacterized protein